MTENCNFSERHYHDDIEVRKRTIVNVFAHLRCANDVFFQAGKNKSFCWFGLIFTTGIKHVCICTVFICKGSELLCSRKSCVYTPLVWNGREVLVKQEKGVYIRF